MPTGYTAAVTEGIGFEDFALMCTRAMGVAVTMRDEPMDAPIPEQFAPSDYHLNKLAEAEKKKADFESATDDELTSMMLKEYDDEEASKAVRKKSNEEQIAAYRRMLAQVQAWEPPTSDHVGLKDFMVQQLTESIKFDDMRGYYEPSTPPTLEDWKSRRLEKINRDIAYHSKEHENEVERTDARNKWLRELRESLTFG